MVSQPLADETGGKDEDPDLLEAMRLSLEMSKKADMMKVLEEEEFRKAIDASLGRAVDEAGPSRAEPAAKEAGPPADSSAGKPSENAFKASGKGGAGSKRSVRARSRRESVRKVDQLEEASGEVEGDCDTSSSKRFKGEHVQEARPAFSGEEDAISSSTSSASAAKALKATLNSTDNKPRRVSSSDSSHAVVMDHMDDDGAECSRGGGRVKQESVSSSSALDEYLSAKEEVEDDDDKDDVKEVIYIDSEGPDVEADAESRKNLAYGWAQAQYQVAARHFTRALSRRLNSEAVPRVEFVEVLQNPRSESAFNRQKEAFEMMGIPTKQFLAYHNASVTTAEMKHIFRNNLRVQNASGFTNGRGVYFSENPDPEVARSTAGILVCKIMPGREYFDKSYRLIPDSYHSKRVPAQAGKDEIIIIENSSQILPAYVIHLERLPLQSSYSLISFSLHVQLGPSCHPTLQRVTQVSLHKFSKVSNDWFWFFCIAGTMRTILEPLPRLPPKRNTSTK